MNGFVTIQRAIVNWRWYSNANTYRVFTHLIYIANFKDVYFESRLIQRGQCVTSVLSLGKSLKLTAQQVRTALNNLKSTSEITIETTSKYSIITIVNYEMYQQINNQNNKQITNKQQTNNKQTTTNEQSNKDNNDNNKDNRGFKKPSIEEIKLFCTDRKNAINAQYFFDYYEARNWQLSKGVKMKDWKAVIRTWENRDFSNNKQNNKSKNYETFEGIDLL